MNNFLSLYSIFSTVAFVHALPPIEARTLIPSPGEDCVYHWPGHSRYGGTVTKTNDCKDGVSFWQYGKDADVQCCVREHCTAFSDPDGEYGQYSCLNTYKTDECGNGSGKFVAGHCLGDETVQCCHDQLTYVSPTTYNNPGVYPTGGEYEGTKGVVVPTEEGSGTPSSPISDSGDSRAGVVVPSFSTPNTVEGEGRISAYPSSEGSTRSTYGLQPDGTYVVPTLPQAPETQRDSLSWRIIPKGST